MVFVVFCMLDLAHLVEVCADCQGCVMVDYVAVVYDALAFLESCQCGVHTGESVADVVARALDVEEIVGGDEAVERQ